MGKKNKTKKYLISRKEIEGIKYKITEKATKQAVLLTLCAVADELKLTEEKYCKIAVRVDRYAENLDQKIVKLNDFGKSVERNTGIDLGGF